MRLLLQYDDDNRVPKDNLITNRKPHQLSCLTSIGMSVSSVLSSLITVRENLSRKQVHNRSVQVESESNKFTIIGETIPHQMHS